MSHFGIITPPVPGHVHPMAALARELVRRGHRATWFHVEDLRTKVESEGLGYHTVGHKDFPPGYLPRSLAELAQLHGFAAIRQTIHLVKETTEMFCREGPAAIHDNGIDALLVDQMEPVGATLADRFGLPYFTVASALLLNRDPNVPPPLTPWRYGQGPLQRIRNQVGYAVSDLALRPISAVLAKHRSEWRLPAYRTVVDSYSRLAQICQIPSAFDFPRTTLPPTFHYVGPLRDMNREIAFPWDALDGRPLIYASLGTIQNSRDKVFQIIANACRGTGFQLVLSHGGGLSKEQAASLQDRALVVPYAPQLLLLARAALTITHAGLNTVLDSLAAGVPMVAIPITYEQPAIARRVEFTGAGESLQLSELNEDSLRALIRKVTSGDGYRAAAQRMAESSRKAGGVAAAADIVEKNLR